MPLFALAFPQRLTLALLVSAFGLRTLMIITGLALLPLADTVELLHDDAYYYLGIARHMAGGEGTTFGGVSATNGFQWLWQMLLAAAAHVFPDNRTALLQLTVLSGYICFGMLLAWLWCSRRSLGLRWRAALLSGLLTSAYLMRDVFWQGMETTLFLLLFPGLIAWIEQRKQSRLILLVFALLPLVRLDALAILLAGYLVLTRAGVVFNRQTPWLTRWGPLLASSTVLLIYMLANQLIYGVPVPISGMNKALDAPRFANLGIIWFYCTSALGFSGALWMLAEWMLRHQPDIPRDFRRAICVMALATLIQYAYYACLSGWPLWLWYLYIEAGLVAALAARIYILLPYLWQRHPSKHQLIIMRVLIVGIVSAVALAGLLRTNATRPLLVEGLEQICIATDICPPKPALKHSFISANLNLLEKTHHLLDGHILAMGDRAGSLGYWMSPGTKLIQLEGLVEDKTYLEARLNGNAERYLAAQGVDRLIVDREVYPTIVTTQGRLTIIAEPIQGRVSNKGIYPLCFSDAALLASLPSPWSSQPRIYDFHARTPCPQAAWELVQRAAHSAYGMRRLSLPSEYAPDSPVTRLELLDRQRASSIAD